MTFLSWDGQKQQSRWLDFFIGGKAWGAKGGLYVNQLVDVLRPVQRVMWDWKTKVGGGPEQMQREDKKQ